MSDVFRFFEGTAPLLVSVPHDGRRLPADLQARMSAEGRAIPDTDWHVARLYDFAKEMGAYMIVARYSRYVVDLNRPADDKALYPGQLATGLCPRQTFDGRDIYNPQTVREMGFHYETLEGVLAQSHAVSLHVALNEATHHLMNAERLGVHCGSTLKLRNRMPSAASLSRRGVFAPRSTPPP